MYALTVQELKEKLSEKNLPTSGTKTELLKRLLEAGVSLHVTEHAANEMHDLQPDELQQEATGIVSVPSREKLNYYGKRGI